MKKLILFMLLIVLFISQPIIANAWNSWIEDKVVNNLMVIGSIYNKDRTAKLTLGSGGVCLIGKISTTDAAHIGSYVTVGSSADADMPTSSLYYSTDQSKLVYKDSGGNVRDLW
jgi:hypothetical protein